MYLEKYEQSCHLSSLGPELPPGSESYLFTRMLHPMLLFGHGLNLHPDVFYVSEQESTFVTIRTGDGGSLGSSSPRCGQYFTT